MWQRASKASPRVVILLLIGLLLLPGCYWKYRNAAGDPFPTPISVKRIGGSAGVSVSPHSTQPDASSISKTSVVELFVEELDNEKFFDVIVFPYSTLAQVEPDLLLDVTVHIEEKYYWVENILKAILVGASFFVLGPVLAAHFGIVRCPH